MTEDDRKALDAVYLERNTLVALLARMFPSGLRSTTVENAENWDPEWRNCVYIDLPTGQVSWHYHDREHPLFAGLGAYTKPWDGHTTERKYERIRVLLAYISRYGEWRGAGARPGGEMP